MGVGKSGGGCWGERRAERHERLSRQIQSGRGMGYMGPNAHLEALELLEVSDRVHATATNRVVVACSTERREGVDREVRV